jgi:pullulanase/glycogen debranching enzyme
MRVWPGNPYPLGATWDGKGVNFALFSERATKMELCLFDSADSDTQQGNNNTYCQDSELTWLDWQLTDEEREFIEFVREVIAIRREQPVFQRRKFFQGRAIFGADVPDINWFEPSGKPMGEEGWNAGYNQCFGFALAGDLIGDVDERGQPIVGDSILILMNAYHEALPFTLPVRYGCRSAMKVSSGHCCSTRRILRPRPAPVQAASPINYKAVR